MTEFTTLLQQGNAWFFIPSAILLGALHGLEPGHSKTMMAAFIIAIKGTIKQAVMLGLAATISHTAVVWLIAFGGMDGREVTNWQILLFGLTGGLIPCPAAITVLLICIQLKALTLGATLVVSFSIGLALTLVTVGVGAAISVQQVAKRWSGFNTLAKRAPYFSSLLIGLVGVYMGVHGFMGIMR